MLNLILWINEVNKQNLYHHFIVSLFLKKYRLNSWTKFEKFPKVELISITLSKLNKLYSIYSIYISNDPSPYRNYQLRVNKSKILISNLNLVKTS